MRYVRFSILGFILSPRDGQASPMTVPTHETVADMARKLGNHVLSAGFVDFKDGMPVCHGRSTSLDIGSQPDDSERLAIQLGITRVAR